MSDWRFDGWHTGGSTGFNGWHNGGSKDGTMVVRRMAQWWFEGWHNGGSKDGTMAA